MDHRHGSHAFGFARSVLCLLALGAIPASATLSFAQSDVPQNNPAAPSPEEKKEEQPQEPVAPSAENPTPEPPPEPTVEPPKPSEPAKGQESRKEKKESIEPKAKPRENEVPAGLAKIQRLLRAGPVGQDATGKRYLDLVDRNEAAPEDLDSFGTYLARRGYFQFAQAYYKQALERDDQNPAFWLNLGTVRLQLGKLSAALVAYEKARRLDPNDAFTHYNIGVVHDYMRNYDKAVEEYTMALALDPKLGEPTHNPQVVNNERLLAVKLLLYQGQVGALGLPLKSAASAEAPAVAKPPKPARPSAGNR